MPIKPINPSTVVRPYTTESEWLSYRAGDITSTESAALFGQSPYVTAFELFHRKRGTLESSFSSNERVVWGSRLESAIAHGIAEDQGWAIEPLKSYWHIPSERIGSSFDFVITNLPDGPALLEIKNVDSLAYRDGWVLGDDETEAEAPVQIEFQVQHQLLVSGFKRAFIGALVGGNRVVILPRERDETVITAIRQRVAKFWTDVTENREPPAIFPGDTSAVLRLHNHAEPGTVLNATTDEYTEVQQLAAEYHAAAVAEKLAKEDKDTAKAKLLTLIGDHEKVLLPGGSISAGVVADSAGTLVTSEMVGTYVGGRSGYRNCRFYPKKEK
jgi:predicted phage-related endonuclease